MANSFSNVVKHLNQRSKNLSRSFLCCPDLTGHVSYSQLRARWISRNSIDATPKSYALLLHIVTTGICPDRIVLDELIDYCDLHLDILSECAKVYKQFRGQKHIEKKMIFRYFESEKMKGYIVNDHYNDDVGEDGKLIQLTQNGILVLFWPCVSDLDSLATRFNNLLPFHRLVDSAKRRFDKHPVNRTVIF